MTLDGLQGRHWDAVIDMCGYVPRVVRASAELLAPAVEQYLFVSTISVYADLSQPGATEQAPVGFLTDPTTELIDANSYGPLKALCEQEVRHAVGDRSLIIRPGLIVGPYDPTDRFTYWVARVAAGGEVLAPGSPVQHVQFIDVRDLASWMLGLVEQHATGTMHATGPCDPLSLGALLQACCDVSGSAAQPTWVDEQFLLDSAVMPWSELPLWVPALDRSTHGFSAIDCRKAISHGLRFRPLNETIGDTLAWAATRPDTYEWRAGITPERERALLSAWRERNSQAGLND
jgi:2'-hydroxyisoflavone reductase